MNRVNRSKFKSLLTNRDTISIMVKGIAIMSLTLALFFNDLSIIFSDAVQSEATSYVLLVPFILAYLLYRKRKMLRAVIPIKNENQTTSINRLSTIAGILLFTIAVLIYWHGSYTFTPLEYHMIALPIFVAALTLLLFNAQTLRQAAFPIAFLFFLTPPPTEILYTAGAALSSLSTLASSGLAGLMGIPTTLLSEYQTPTIQIVRPDGTQLQFVVDIACSGIYSLIGFIIFAALLAYIVRDKPWKKIALILTGIPLIYLLNVSRITTLLAIGYHYGENVALEFFHAFGGWVLNFLGTILLLAISEKIYKTNIFSQNTKQCPECQPKKENEGNLCNTCGRVIRPKNTPIHKKDLIKITTLILIVAILLSIQAPTFALTQTPTSEIVTTPTGEVFSTQILPDIPNYQLEFDYRDTEFEELAEQDMSIAYVYYPEKANLKPIWVTIEIASRLFSLHRWELCLIQYPLSQGLTPKVVQQELTDMQISENPLIISRYFLFDNIETNQTQSVLYWYESALFETNSTSQQKHVKISVIAYPDDFMGSQELKDQQLAIAQSIINYWEPIKLWSYAILPISKAGGYLAIFMTVILAATLFYYLRETKKQRQASRNSYNKLSKTTREIIDAVSNTQKNKLPTLDHISKALQEATNETISKKDLLEKLRKLERERIIEGQIINSDDQPLQIWKI